MPLIDTGWGPMAYELFRPRGDAGAAATPAEPTLLFLHGTGCDARDYDAVRAALPPAASSVVLEFRGHGRSAVPAEDFTLEDLADDVLLAIEQLNLSRPILVGHSLGGMVALAAARQAWDRVGGMVLLEGWTRLSASAGFAPGRFFGRLAPETVAHIRRKTAATQGRFAPERWARFWRSVETFDGYDALLASPIPIIEAYGQLGRTDETQRDLRVPETPMIEWAWLPDAGHYLPLECPSGVAELCQRMRGHVK